MNPWLARLKKLKGPDAHPTKPTEPGFVGFVGTLDGHIQKIKVGAASANDAPGVWNVYVRAGTSSQTVAKFRSASLALDAAQRAAGVSPLRDPDAGCGPNSAAMNGSEIDTFTARRHRFADKGLPRDAADALADNLVLRDREKDDRRVCFECKSFTGHGPLSWRCANWDVAGVAIRSFDAQLPADLVTQLQRCDGFAKRFT